MKSHSPSAMRRIATIDRLKNDRDNAQFAVDQHRDSCKTCRSLGVPAIAAGNCEDGSRLADALLTANRQIARL